MKSAKKSAALPFNVLAKVLNVRFSNLTPEDLEDGKKILLTVIEGIQSGTVEPISMKTGSKFMNEFRLRAMELLDLPNNTTTFWRCRIACFAVTKELGNESLITFYADENQHHLNTKVVDAVGMRTGKVQDMQDDTPAVEFDLSEF